MKFWTHLVRCQTTIESVPTMLISNAALLNLSSSLETSVHTDTGCQPYKIHIRCICNTSVATFTNWEACDRSSIRWHKTKTFRRNCNIDCWLTIHSRRWIAAWMWITHNQFQNYPKKTKQKMELRHTHQMMFQHYLMNLRRNRICCAGRWVWKTLSKTCFIKTQIVHK